MQVFGVLFVQILCAKTKQFTIFTALFDLLQSMIDLWIKLTLGIVKRNPSTTAGSKNNAAARRSNMYL